jgi:long-chain acyl-CoA synthetase
MTFAAGLAKERGDQLALRDPGGSWTWSEADAALRPLVNALLATDLRPSRRVAIYAHNSGQTLLHYVAATLSGCSAVAVNFHLTPSEAAYIFEDSDVDVVFVDDVTAANGVEAAELAKVALVVGGSGQVAAAKPLNEWLSGGGQDDPPTNHPPLPTIVYTSGTTGRPKAVELPATSWVGGANIDEHVERLAQNSMVRYGRHLVVGPMYHSGPLSSTRLFIGGAPVTVLGRFDAERLLEAIERDRIASSIVVPTHLQRMLALPDDVRRRFDVSSLEFVLQVGAKCPEPVKRKSIEWLGPVLWESYGASEVGTTCMISASEWLERPGSVGRAIPPFEAMILGDDDEPVPPGTQGRLFFRDTSGHGLRYLRASAEDVTLGPDVFTLGEIGIMDAEGYVWITDRASDMIVSGGVNIYPAEAEQVLAMHPAVAEAACIGLPHEEMGEQLVAVVVPAESAHPPAAADLIAWCRERLSHYKCPRGVYFVDELSRTPLGKIDKRTLRARVTASPVDS